MGIPQPNALVSSSRASPVMIESEVFMCVWIARYEEGYVTTDGFAVLLVNELCPGAVWRTPDEARRHWLSQDALAGAMLETFGNGFVQTDDVSGRLKFRELGVAKIWRRITFERSQDSVRMNPRFDANAGDR
jgi:hypothetical protein